MRNVLAIVFCALLLPATALAQMSVDERTLKLGQAWQWMEAGSLDKADEAFKLVLADAEGGLLAEVHYGLAAVWWQKRNAMASYQRLVEAAAMSKSPGWQAGEGAQWDARIQARIDYIQKNFTVVKMRAGSKNVLPPLADPPPRDPLVRGFSDAMALAAADAAAEGLASQWHFVPNGTYWLGDALEVAGGGEMDPSRADTWQLPRRTGPTKAAYEARVEAIAAGKSPAQERLAAGAKQPEGGPGGEQQSLLPDRAPTQIHERVFALGVHGGLAPARALDGLDASVAADWTIGVQAEGRIPLPADILSLAVGAGWRVLPVNGCRVAPTRGHLAALHVGPALQLPLAGALSLSVDANVRGGVLLGGRSLSARQACASAIADSESAPGAVSRGARITSGGQTGVVSMADLGWAGTAAAIGGELAAGVVIDGGGAVGFGAQLVFAYDHLIPVLPDGGAETVWIRDPGTGSIVALSKGSAVSAASMGRMQIGLRIRLLL